MSTVTLKDIAQEVGVTTMTVSKVVNGKDHDIGDATRQKVQKAIKQLGYRPNFYAQSLKSGKTYQIGITTFKDIYKLFTDAYITELIAAAGEKVSANNYKLVLQNFKDVSSLSTVSELASQRRVDALIYIVLANDIDHFKMVELQRVRATGIPFIPVHSTMQDMGCASVGLNTHKGGCLAAEHLLSFGYGSYGCAVNWQPRHHCEELADGFRSTLQKAGITMAEQTTFEFDEFNADSGYRLGKELIDKGTQLPRALFVTNDYVALGMMKAFNDQDISVPDDIALVGFGGHAHGYNYGHGLTTVTNPAHLKGRAAAKALFKKMIHKNEDTVTVLVEPELKTGESSGTKRDN